MSPAPASRYAGIDALRGLAAVWVMLSHYLPHWARFLGPTLILVPNSWGPFAVDLFFIISGFVIFMTLGKCRTLAQFLWMRFTRLYPVYWATLFLSLGAGILLFGEKPWPASIAAHLTMFEEFFGFPRHDDVYWSLTVELAFYMNCAWVFALGWHRFPLRVTAVWLALSIAWALAFPGDLDADHRSRIALFTACDYSPFFALGIVFFEASRNGWSPGSFLLLGLSFVAEYFLGGFTGVWVALSASILFLMGQRGWLGFLENRFNLWLGAISYSVYLVHRNLGYACLDWLHGKGLGPGLAVPLVIAVILALASVSTFGLERPALRRLRPLAHKPK